MPLPQKSPAAAAGTQNYWNLLKTSKLAAPAATISLTPLTAYDNYWAEYYIAGYAVADWPKFQFNGDAAANYALTYAETNPGGGLSGNKVTGSTFIYAGNAGAQVTAGYGNMYVGNPLATEKHGTIFAATQSTAAGAANAPALDLFAFKWANTVAKISRIDLLTNGGNNFLAGTWLSVYGA